MSSTVPRKNAARKSKKEGIIFVPLKKKDVERSITETLLRDHEAVKRGEVQLSEILQAWTQMGITPMTMVFLATQLQEFSMVVYHEGYKEATTGMWGKLTKSNREVFEKDFENMCKAIRRHGLNALMSHLEERKKERDGRSNNESSQITDHGNEEASYVASKERPYYIY